MAKKTDLCRGCRDDYYNGNNERGIGECWRLKSARRVTRYRIGWWTRPTSVDAFTKVVTFDCHHAPGQYADFEKLPDHLVTIKRATGRARSEESDNG